MTPHDYTAREGVYSAGACCLPGLMTLPKHRWVGPLACRRSVVMYSVVLLMALSGGVETPAADGCAGGYACGGGVACNGGGCHGGRVFGGHGCHGGGLFSGRGCHGGGLFSGHGCHGGSSCAGYSSCAGSSGCNG